MAIVITVHRTMATVMVDGTMDTVIRVDVSEEEMVELPDGHIGTDCEAYS